MSDLINPNLYVPGHVRENDPRFAGGKYYLAKLGGNGPVLVGREKHKRASAADFEAERWKEKLVNEYDRALLTEVPAQEPTA